MDWDKVARTMVGFAAAGKVGQLQLNQGQQASLRAISVRLPKNGVIIADEVGMGKTRISVAVARSVIDCGGRVAILVPPGLGFQWRAELHGARIQLPPVLRSLWQYLAAWEPKIVAEQDPWFKQSALLISHAFTNWRLGENAAAWRWALLPAVYAEWRRATSGRYPRGYRDQDNIHDPWVQGAAKSIVSAAQPETPMALKMAQCLDELGAETPWPGAIEAAEYAANEALRPRLEQAVGLGLGVFDLVIIDEAHKSRNHDSALSKLLERVVIKNDDTRRIAMTATPVELNAEQWKSTLRRIAVDVDGIGTVIQDFANNVRRVRQSLSDAAARNAYYASAKEFETQLKPYLLRRDKRQDPSVIAFARYTGLPIHAYRCRREIEVEPTTIPVSWRQVVCAAEALSIVTRGTADGVAKRLRLTLGSGHGIATLVDEPTAQVGIDQDSDSDSEIPSSTTPVTASKIASSDTSDASATEDKRIARARWWKEIIAQTVGNDGRSLFDHPALQSAVAAIESTVAEGEKVLVFGRFTLPLQALVRLLNARALLRAIDYGHPWPQSTIEEEEWPAIEVAHSQLERTGDLDRRAINEQLAEQYRKLEKRRENLRRHLVEDIADALRDQRGDTRLARLFAAFRASAAAEQPHPGGDPGVLALVTRALLELLPESDVPHPQDELADAFAKLIDALSEHAEVDSDGDGVLDTEEAVHLWDVLQQRLAEEYKSPQSRFARLMNGNTKPETRRLLQLAFNRRDSWPQVLVSQSQVGREGLNLHTACRVVVLLHPEWNPGVVEQQMGRVDRVGSHWEERCREAMDQGQSGNALPCIEFRPVIFRGTYDAWHWEVLQQRWDDLRAQLHGVIIPPHEAAAYLGLEPIIDEINQAAPNFYP